MTISKRVSGIEESATLSLNARLKALKAKGEDVISFAVGEPDFETPQNIKAAGISAIEKGFTKYTETAGIIELREAISRKLKIENGVDYSPSQIIVSCGAKHSLFNVVNVLCDTGDEVIIPRPYWVTYPEQVKLAGAVAKFVDVDPRTMKVSHEAIARAVTSRTKAFILNSPCNPTGVVYTREELEAIAECTVKRGIYVISDEIYELLVYGGARHVCFASLGEEAKKCTVVVNGVSKAFSMTGWRIGYAAGPSDVINAAVKLQDHTTSNPASMAQIAALEALSRNRESVREMVEEFDRRRTYMYKKLREIPGITCTEPQGAFYCFANISGVVGTSIGGRRIEDSLTFSELLLEREKVGVVPGEAFGVKNFIRLSYATSMSRIEEGMERLKRFLQ